ncbi:hypothetical protein S-CBS2_gp010 [Synechococcus phage S-CBS2]|uniref:hypothetical protein n=1 Tax=Synechococcus phage S-CBS2 TaxID=753084 RepID=UPI00020783E3|nr:hypothetical protein S-CBS2_gp010 [Synechococcus phage S-CBS2]ADF42366.1 hypothetical protein S-CBS2_gp010 [Synechococcus phage S-CBS2]
MAMTLNPATSESYITTCDFKVAPSVGSLPSTTIVFSDSEPYAPSAVLYSKWTEILTGSGFQQPISGTPVFEGGGGGSPRPSSGFLYPRAF